MNSEDSSSYAGEAVETDSVYTLEIVAELAGVSTQTVLHYREMSLIKPVAEDEARHPVFDMEGLRQLRRIEHVRTFHEVNDATLKLIMRLADEVDTLREKLRALSR